MRRLFLCLTVLAVLPARAPAQQPAPAQQRPVEQLRDSLSRATNISELRRRVATLSRGAQAEQTAALLERGLVLLRLYELTRENKDGDAARKAFERIIQRDPNNGWAHYCLGLALAGGPGVRLPTPGGVLDGFVLGQSLAEIIKQDPRSKAGREFLKAIELDPTLEPAAIRLAELALDSRDKDLLKETRTVLQGMVARNSGSDDLTAALARVQSALGDVAAAEETARTASAHGGGNALLAHAEALLRQPGKEEEGARAYFAAAARVDAHDIEGFFTDVRYVANEREIADWKNGSLEERRAWIERFWTARAAGAGRTEAERVAEHYRRVAEAQNRYRRAGQRGAPPSGAMLQNGFHAEQLPFDERGIIYVRHGDPEHVIKTSSPDLRANESWVYTLPGGKQQLFHFVVLRDGTDYRLVDDILHALDPSSQDMPFDGVISLLEDRGAYDQRYYLMAGRFNAIRGTRWAASAASIQCMIQGGSNCAGPGSAAGELGDNASGTLQNIAMTRLMIATENREAALSALATDSDRPRFSAPMPFYYDVYTFKGSSKQTDVTAAIAIPGTSLQPRRVDDQLVYSVQLSLIVIDTIFGTVTRRDTTYNLRSPRTLGPSEHLRLSADLAAPASTTTVHRLVLRDLGAESKGQMYGGDTTVPAYDATGLLISDIVLAEPATGTWRRGNASLALVPPRQFPGNQPLTLFYELYNLPADTRYRTEITLAPTAGTGGLGRIRKLFGGNDGTIRIEFDGSATVDEAGRVQETRRVTTEVKPGKYRVEVRVTNLANQQVAAAVKEFVVTGR